jgi:hypothetical protein
MHPDPYPCFGSFHQVGSEGRLELPPLALFGGRARSPVEHAPEAGFRKRKSELDLLSLVAEEEQAQAVGPGDEWAFHLDVDTEGGEGDSVAEGEGGDAEGCTPMDHGWQSDGQGQEGARVEGGWGARDGEVYGAEHGDDQDGPEELEGLRLLLRCCTADDAWPTAPPVTPLMVPLPPLATKGPRAHVAPAPLGALGLLAGGW